MPVTPVGHLLIDIGAPGPAAAMPYAAAAPASGASDCQCEEKLRLEAETAHARGYGDGYAKGRSERNASEQEVSTRLAAEQNARLTALASEVFDKLETGLGRVRSQISATAAGLLADFFLGRLKEEAIDAAAGELSALLSEGDASRIIVRGPKEWIDRLVSLPEVAKSAARVEAIVCEQVDVSISIDQAMLETTIGKWIACIGVAK